MEISLLAKFSIGEEFAEHEFELEYIKTETDKDCIDYDLYRYTGKDISNVMGYELKEVVLAYNCDILKGVFCIANEA